MSELLGDMSIRLRRLRLPLPRSTLKEPQAWCQLRQMANVPTSLPWSCVGNEEENF